MTEFEKELEAGFIEFAEVAGNARFTLRGLTFGGLIYGPSPAQLRVDVAMGRSYLVRVEVARSLLPTPRPAVGETLVESRGVKYDITDIMHHDITDPTIVYVCRTTGKAS